MENSFVSDRKLFQWFYLLNDCQTQNGSIFSLVLPSLWELFYHESLSVYMRKSTYILYNNVALYVMSTLRCTFLLHRYRRFGDFFLRYNSVFFQGDRIQVRDIQLRTKASCTVHPVFVSSLGETSSS